MYYKGSGRVSRQLTSLSFSLSTWYYGDFSFSFFLIQLICYFSPALNSTPLRKTFDKKKSQQME
jgi:hypothetical protein